MLMRVIDPLRELLFCILLALAQFIGTRRMRVHGTEYKCTFEYEALDTYVHIHYDAEECSARRANAIAAIRSECEHK